MSTALAIPTGTITGQVVNGSGVAVAGVLVTAKLYAGNSTPQSIAPAGQVVPVEVSAYTDVNGFWSLALIPNNNITPANTTYVVSVAGMPDVSIQLNDTASHAYLSLAVGGTGATLNPAGQTVAQLTVTGELDVAGPAVFHGPNPWIDITHPAYGGKGDGVTDNSAAFTLALAALPSGGTIFFPPGVFVFASGWNLNSKSFIRIRGAGPVTGGGSNGASVVKFTTTTSPLISAASSFAIQFEDLQVQWPNAFTGTVLAYDGTAGSPTALGRVMRCFFQATGGGSAAALILSLDQSIYMKAEDSEFQNAQVAVQGIATAGHFSNKVTIRDCVFSTATGTIAAAHLQNPGQGWGVEGSAFEMGQGQGNVVILRVTAGNGGAGVGFIDNWIGDQGANAVNQFTPGATGSGYKIAGNYWGGSATSTAINLPNGFSGAEISGNIFDTASVALNFGGNNNRIFYAGNFPSTVTTEINGTGNSGVDVVVSGTRKAWGAFQNFGDLSNDRGFGPGTPAAATQAGRLYMGSGVPSNANGNNGDFYFRTDTPGTANQRLYNKQAGTWTGIL